ncbi:MAG: hypothetical protein H6623_07065 [Bdellovibrionaceae bacterium]|nr:hypothetical protein [Pseudobdellovibrionaceae bacterium]
MKTGLKKLVTFFICAITLMPQCVQANNIVVPGVSGNHVMKPVAAKSDNLDFIETKIEICTEDKMKSSCTVYPENAGAFKGSPSDWGYFFNRCSQFSHTNNFTDITQAVATIAVMPSVGFIKKVALEALQFTALKESYPDDVDQVALQKTLEMVLFSLKNEKKIKNENPRYFNAAKQILQKCSTLLATDYRNYKAGGCIGQCHDHRNTDHESARNNYYNNRRLDRNDSQDLQDLSIYVKSIAH